MSDYTDSGVLFKNDRKENEKQPDYTGKINVGGVEKRLAAWINEGKNGKKYMSLKVSDPQGPGEKASEAYRDAAQPVRPGPVTDEQPAHELDDEIPF